LLPANVEMVYEVFWATHKAGTRKKQTQESQTKILQSRPLLRTTEYRDNRDLHFCFCPALAQRESRSLKGGIQPDAP